MAPSKRSAAGAPVGAAGAKKQRPSPLEAGCASVAAALRQAELPEAVLQTTLAALPFSLAQPKEERHKFQTQMVDTIGALLESHGERLAGAIKAASLAADAATEQKASRDADFQRCEAETEAKNATRHEAKVALAVVAKAFQASKKAMLAAKEGVARGESSLATAKRRRDEAQVLLKMIPDVHESAGGIPNFVKSLERHIPVDDSLKTAIPCSFAKAPEDRGHFDHLVVQQVTEGLDRHLAELEATLSSDELEKLRQEELARKKELDTKKAAQMASAQGFGVTDDAAKASETALAAARKELSQAAKQLKDASNTTTEAQVNLEIFNDGPLAAFHTLRDRSVPPAPEAVEVVTAKVEEEAVRVVEPATAGA